MPKRIGIYVLSGLLSGCLRGSKTPTPPREEPKPSFPWKEDSKLAPVWGDEYPQRSDAQTLFEEAPSLTHSAGKVELLCHFTFPAQMTFNRLFKATESIDPEVFIKLPSGDSVSYYLGDNLTSAYLAVPVNSVSNGDTLSFSIIEVRDVFKNDLLDTFEIPFAGSFPIEASNPEQGISMECKASTQETAEGKLSSELTAIDQSLESIKSTLPVNTTSPDGGYQSSGLPELIKAIEGAAVYMGWKDPRVQQRAEALSQLLVLWDQKLKGSLSTPGEAIVIGKTGVNVKLISTSNTFSEAQTSSDAKFSATFEVENTSKKDVTVGFDALFLYNQLDDMTPQVAEELIKRGDGREDLLLKKGTRTTVEVKSSLPTAIYYDNRKEQLMKLKLFAISVNQESTGLLLIP